jgi:16S rRNA (cytidine1402-2'-O)-methyltransferase
MPRLYVVATPIGNLEDISLRVLRVLAEAGAIAAEDTRSARVLLDHFSIKARRLISYNEHNREQRIPLILSLLADNDVALVSDAGTPAISDPGVELVAAARDAGFEVVAVPGPSAPTAALSVAGLRATSFCFAGFLPRNAGDLRRFFEAQAARPETLVAFESPQRLQRTLATLAQVVPERRIAVCRELTKLHEEVFVGKAAEAAAHFAAPKGEVVLVIEGSEAKASTEITDEAPLLADIVEMRTAGLTRAQATTLLGRRYRLSRRRHYELWLQSSK